MRRTLPLRAAPAIALLAGLVAAAPAVAQEDELSSVIRGEAATRLAIAVPPTVAGSPSHLAAADEVGRTLRADLDYSGWFGLLDPRGEGRIPPDRLGDAAAWRGVGAAYLATTRLDVSGTRARLNVRLVETGGGTVLFDRTWGGSVDDDLRRLAHVASDHVVETLTGTPGIAQTRIAFVAKRGEAKEVYLVDYDGARVRRLTTTGTINLSPSWSPDARRMTFLSFRGRKPSIYLLGEDGTITTLRPAGGELNAAPEFSPDGRTIAFSSDRDDNSEIYLYDLATGGERRLTRHPAIDTAPSWSPDGSRIAFTSDRSGSPQIYVMNADGSDPRRLSWEGRYNESAAFSPDGRRLAFVSRIAGRFEIVLHDMATGRETIITRGPGNKENPRWAPDGRHLVFAGNATGEYQIWTVRDDGSDLRQLTRGAPAWTPDWSPIRR